MSFVKSAKQYSGRKFLQDCFLSSERVRTHQILNKLTNLNQRKNSQESMHDYSMRAEELQHIIPDIGGIVCDQMLCSVVSKGSPNSFASFVIVFKFSHENKLFADKKRDLSIHDIQSCRGQSIQATSSQLTNDVEWFKSVKIWRPTK